MREYTQGLVRLGFHLISAEDIGKDVFLIYFHYEDGCLITLESTNYGKHVKPVCYYVWSPETKVRWAFTMIDFAAKDPSGDLRSERHHATGPYFVAGQTLWPLVSLLEDKLEMMRLRGKFLLPWPEQPILKLCPDRYLASITSVNKRQAKLQDVTSATFARFPLGIRAVLSPQ